MLNGFRILGICGCQRIDVMAQIFGKIWSALRRGQFALTRFFPQFGCGGNRTWKSFHRLILLIAEGHASTVFPRQGDLQIVTRVAHPKPRDFVPANVFGFSEFGRRFRLREDEAQCRARGLIFHGVLCSNTPGWRLAAEEISFGAICLHIDKSHERFIWPPCLSKGRLATVWFTSQQLFPDVLTHFGRMRFTCKN